MQENRIGTLLQYLQEDPNDAFTLYALALEYISIDSSKSYQIFKNLVDNHPNYVATYYQFGSLLQAQKNIVEAEKIYLKGIEIAILTKDYHTLAELKSSLVNMHIENDEDI